MKSIRSHRARGGIAVLAMAITATLPWFTAGAPASAAATVTSFSYELDPAVGDVGRGTSTPDDSEFRVTGTAGRVQAFIDTPQGFWLVQFQAQYGTQLVPGAYAGAKRFASPDAPGLDVGGRWNCYDATGTFTIRAITADAWGDIVAFDATFEQACGSSPDNATFRAELRYNAPVDAPVVVTASNPSTIEQQPATFTALVAAGGGDDPTGTVAFLDGATVLGTVPVSKGMATFTTEGLAVGAHEIVASYSGDGSHAPAASAATLQTVNDSRMSMWLSSESGDYIGRGATRSWTVPTSAFAIQTHSNPFDAVQVTVDAPKGMFTLRFANLAGQMLEEGTYEDARSTAPYHDATRPGLYVGGEGAGCQGGGRFVVAELRRDQTGQVLVFDATFEYNCELFTAGLRGRVRYAASTRTTLTGSWWLDYGAEDREPFTIQVTSTKPTPPTGTVTLAGEDGAAVCTATLSNGAATCTLGPKQLLPGGHLLKATYTPDTGSLRPSTSEPLGVQVWHGQTTLAVDSVRAADVATTQQMTYRARLTARLTGEPLEARVVSFGPNRPLGVGTGTGTGECSATTDAQGWASCSVPATGAAPSANGFHAEWEGDDRYYPTSANAAFVA
ncbi:MAG TPA: Ig-like domain-containing protein [Acidimicrobiales bacterium]